MDLLPIISILCVFIGAPGIVFGFIYFSRKNKFKLEELKIRREMLELEVEKEYAHIKSVEAENAKYDRLIADDRKPR